jgi:hypothetical protein
MEDNEYYLKLIPHWARGKGGMQIATILGTFEIRKMSPEVAARIQEQRQRAEAKLTWFWYLFMIIGILILGTLISLALFI